MTSREPLKVLKFQQIKHCCKIFVLQFCYITKLLYLCTVINSLQRYNIYELE